RSQLGALPVGPLFLLGVGVLPPARSPRPVEPRLRAVDEPHPYRCPRPGSLPLEARLEPPGVTRRRPRAAHGPRPSPAGAPLQDSARHGIALPRDAARCAPLGGDAGARGRRYAAVPLRSAR